MEKMLQIINKKMRYLKIDIYDKFAAVIVLFSAILRLFLISQNWPITDSDESTMGLMALHIANKGEHPIFFYGQHYMGSLEAFLAAGLFHFFGPSTFALRLVLVIFFALFLTSLYLLVSQLYTKKFALLAIGLLCFGADAIFNQELISIGGYPDVLLFATFSFFLSSWLVLSASANSVHPQKWRFLVYAALGVALGLGLWSDLLILPFVLTVALLLVIGCWREWRTLAIPVLLLGLLVGAFPLIYYNLHAQPGQDSLSVLLTTSTVDKTAHLPVINQVIGSFFISLPLMTGVNPTCSVISGQHILFDNIHPFRCTVEYDSWAIGYGVLWVLAALFASINIGRLLRQQKIGRWSDNQRHHAMRNVARLLLLASAAITMYLYASSPNSARWPQFNYRYLVGLVIVLPAVLYPLWVEKIPNTLGTKLLAAARGTLLVLIAIFFVIGTLRIFYEIPVAQATNIQRLALVQNLLKIKAHHIYSDYWTCGNVDLESNERIVCAEYHGTQRYQPYIITVTSDPRSAYVFQTGSPLATDRATQARQHPGSYQFFTFDGYDIYVPILKK
jgi:hypothetical protein